MENPQDSNPQNQSLKVVARYRTGAVLKGTSQDFTNMRPTFHLLPEDGSPARIVKLKDLKAVFFVRDLAGDPNREHIAGFIQAPMETVQGKKIAVLFQDGELLCGYTHSWTPDREGFFLIPCDMEGNNLRIYVISAAAQQTKAGPAAEALAQRVLEERSRRSA